jgi:predicted RNase H-like HicB family nuclease
MAESITLEVALDGYVRRDTLSVWVSICPQIGVASQGETSARAKAALQEAVELWFESCIERGVLEQALREANFRPSPLASSSRRRSTTSRESTLDVRGQRFTMRLRIPAYQAPNVLSATA